MDEHEVEAHSFLDKFTEYAENHLSGSEADDIKDASKGKAQAKLSTLKPDLTFARNSRQEALLPEDCMDLKLEEKKHVFRCFLKSQYGGLIQITPEITRKLTFPRACQECYISRLPMHSTLGKDR